MKQGEGIIRRKASDKSFLFGFLYGSAPGVLGIFLESFPGMGHLVFLIQLLFLPSYLSGSFINYGAYFVGLFIAYTTRVWLFGNIATVFGWMINGFLWGVISYIAYPMTSPVYAKVSDSRKKHSLAFMFVGIILFGLLTLLAMLAVYILAVIAHPD
jgi:hypothetical protein